MVPFIHNSYGVAGAWCWIRDWKDDCATQKYIEGIIEQFVLMYIPLFASMTVTVVAVFIIIIVLVRQAYAHTNQEKECHCVFMGLLFRLGTYHTHFCNEKEEKTCSIQTSNCSCG